jgi:hypothetical protein
VESSFTKRLCSGHRGERVIVDWLRSQGLAAAHGVKLVVANFRKSEDHIEAPDAVPFVGVPVIVEMKGRDLVFTGAEDFPFSTVYLEAEVSADRACRTWAWIIYSIPTGAATCVLHTDRDASWRYQMTTDRERQSSYRVLTAPKRFLRPLSDLTQYILPQKDLKYIDGSTAAFTSGGGFPAPASLCAPRASSRTGARASEGEGQVTEHVG